MDIVKQLRSHTISDEIIDQAADEIERLRLLQDADAAEIDLLRGEVIQLAGKLADITQILLNGTESRSFQCKEQLPLFGLTCR
jgi:hypothetical protein